MVSKEIYVDYWSSVCCVRNRLTLAVFVSCRLNLSQRGSQIKMLKQLIKVRARYTTSFWWRLVTMHVVVEQHGWVHLSAVQNNLCQDQQRACSEVNFLDRVFSGITVICDNCYLCSNDHVAGRKCVTVYIVNITVLFLIVVVVRITSAPNIQKHNDSISMLQRSNHFCGWPQHDISTQLPNFWTGAYFSFCADRQTHG